MGDEDQNNNIDTDTGIDTSKPLITGDLKKSFMFSAEALTDAAAAADPGSPAFKDKTEFKSADEMTPKDLAGNKTLGELAADYEDPERRKALDEARERESKRKERATELEGKTEEEQTQLKEQWKEEDEGAASIKADREKELEGKSEDEQKVLKEQWEKEDADNEGKPPAKKEGDAEDEGDRKAGKGRIRVSREPAPAADATDDDDIPADDIQDQPTAETKTAYRTDVYNSLNDDEKALYESLAEEAKETLVFYKNAERVSPTKFKGAFKSQLDYLTELDARVSKIREDDPDADLEDNEKLLRWIENNKPEFSKVELNKARDEILRDEIRREVEDKNERRFKRIEQKPQVEKATQAFSDRIFDDALALDSEETADFKEVVALIDERGIKAAKEEFPEEVEAFEAVHRESTKNARTFISMRRGLVDYDKNNPEHSSIVQTVNKFNDDAVREMNDPKIESNGVNAEGKKFVHIKKWIRMSDTERENHWTFETGDLLALMANKALNDAHGKVSAEIERKHTILKRQAEKSGIPVEKLLGKKVVGKAEGESTTPKKTKKDAKEEAAESASASSSRSQGSGGKGKGSDSGNRSFAIHGPAALES